MSLSPYSQTAFTGMVTRARIGHQFARLWNFGH